jgi:hypothetical protein
VLLDPSLWQGEDPPEVGLDRLSPEQAFEAFSEYWRERETEARRPSWPEEVRA